MEETQDVKLILIGLNQTIVQMKWSSTRSTTTTRNRKVKTLFQDKDVQVRSEIPPGGTSYFKHLIHKRYRIS